MNISLSYNWIKEFVPTTLSPEEFAAAVSLRGPSVERVRRVGAGLDGIVVGRVVDVRPHPNADKLRLASVDAGKEIIGVVCGGVNLSVGMKVAFARIGSSVRWHGEGELVELTSAEIRGVKSFGMICAANEIGLADLFPHAEREIMDVSSVTAVPGTPLATALGLDDAVLDIEVTTNRIDAFSVTGMAREAGAILGLTAVRPARESTSRKARTVSRVRPGTRATGISVAVQSKHLCPRYQAAVIRGLAVGASPGWLKQRLAASGLRPINIAVDVANYVMLELGHPLHAFDAAKLRRGIIVVREARDGEEITALDGKTYALAPGMLVIADAERPVAIAGIMGSAESGVTPATTDVVIEAAVFDPAMVRKTARALGISSDAALRFEKGIHPESTSAALERAVALLTHCAGGAADPHVVDVRAATWKPRAVTYRPQAASDLAGVTIDSTGQRRNLERLGFDVTSAGKTWKVTIPWQRDADMEGERDIIEEVVRLFGYGRIPEKLPEGRSGARRRSPEYDLETDLKEFFRGAGFLETQTIPLVPDAWAPDGLRLANPLASDAARARTSLIPSLLDVVMRNQEQEPALRFFEIARIYLPRGQDLPEEPTMLLAVLASASPAGEQFFAARGILDAIGARFSIPFEIRPADHHLIDDQELHPGRCLSIQAGGHRVGFLGELNPFAIKKFGVAVRVAVLSLDLAYTFRARTRRSIHDLPVFPAVKRDLSFIVPQRTTHADIVAVMNQATPLLVRLELFDVFSGTDVPSGKKSMTYHLEFRSDDRTLTADEISGFESKIKKALESKFGAVLR